MAFRILSLSGGGYLGLYTASVLAEMERLSGRQIYEMFDLIAGTSIGGITALGLSHGVPAKEIVAAFKSDGERIFPPRPAGRFSSKIALMRHAKNAKYAATELRRTAVNLVGETLRMGGLRQRTVIPAVNLTKGQPQVFRTPHYGNLLEDKYLQVVDVCLATSAAPTFFPIHRIGEELFADGSLYANSPGEIAMHEAQHFLGQSLEDVHILSIGATTSRFSFAGNTGLNMGWYGWVAKQNLPSVMISAQQISSDQILRHRLGDRYLRIDRMQTESQAKHLALDVASPASIGLLTGMASASMYEFGDSAVLSAFMDHIASLPDFDGEAALA